MNVLVIGATGGSGRAVCDTLLQRGHAVTALARRASVLAPRPGLTPVDADATDLAAIERILPGHDAVVVTLGISESALRVRLRGARNTPDDIRSRATRLVLDAASRAGIRRIVVQSSYGVGPTRRLPGFLDRLVISLLLRPQFDDTELQERFVRESGLDWTIVQPVYLTDADSAEHFVSTDGRIRGRSVSRRGVAQVHAELVERPAMIGETVSVSD